MAPADDLPAPLPPGRRAAPPAATPTPGPTGPAVRVVELDWRSVAVVLGGFVVLVAATALIGSAPRTMAALGVAAILSLGLNPLVENVRRRPADAEPPAVAAVLALSLIHI